MLDINPAALPTINLSPETRAIFGNYIEKLYVFLETKAALDSSGEAFAEAYHALDGIGKLMTIMILPNSDRTALLPLLNKLKIYAENPSYRAALVAEHCRPHNPWNRAVNPV